MSEMSLHEVGKIIRNYRRIETICKEWGISPDEVEKAFPESVGGRDATDLRSALKLAVNWLRLKEVADETKMPDATYLVLEQAFAHGTSDSTRLRDDRPLTKEEFKQRAGSRSQMNLFDDTEAVVISTTHPVEVYEDEIGYPRG